MESITQNEGLFPAVQMVPLENIATKSKETVQKLKFLDSPVAY